MLSYLLGIVVFHVLLGVGLFSKTPSRTYDNSDSTSSQVVPVVLRLGLRRTPVAERTRHATHDTVAEQLSKKLVHRAARQR